MKEIVRHLIRWAIQSYLSDLRDHVDVMSSRYQDARKEMNAFQEWLDFFLLDDTRP